MEEHQSTRITDIVKPEDVHMNLVDASFSWGFRVSEDQVDKDVQNKTKSQSQITVKVDTIDEPIISDLNFELKHDDLLVVIG